MGEIIENGRDPMEADAFVIETHGELTVEPASERLRKNEEDRLKLEEEIRRQTQQGGGE